MYGQLQDPQEQFCRLLYRAESMASFHTLLRTEIGKFEKHVRDCRDTFDLGRLSQFLTALTEPDTGSVDSVQQVRQLARERGNNKLLCKGSSCDASAYASWLCTYIDYLRALKETFDDKVIIPLCEELYVNEDTGSQRVHSDSSNCSSSLSSQASSQQERVSESCLMGQQEMRMDSIPKIAKELFNVRRKWALLLTADTIRTEYFTSQSITDLHKTDTPKHLNKILRLVPDIYCKCLLTADLARQWLQLHERRYGGVTLPVPVTDSNRQRTGTQSLDRGKGLSVCEEAQGMVSRKREKQLHPMPKVTSEELDDLNYEKVRVRVDDEELHYLVRREERVRNLQRLTQKSGFRVHELQLQLEQVKQGMDLIHRRQEVEGGNNGTPQTNLRLIEELEGKLRLEKYKYRILQADWLLQLEIEPYAIRHMELLRDQQEKSQRLEREKAPQRNHTH
ncbi:uncharacterized protein LOC132817363 [Hemiscyllium ocellatum]|uniref:uncharacterized protein LOC132817363 n=1 Tax=Hemiscyllium ocellatum TaxID=170820 RepID=UPI0029674890|nr:uncharacterized protein LOC132817363 [Hemiscyllium ocellatum]